MYWGTPMPTDEVDGLLAEFVTLRVELEGTWEERRLLMEHGIARGHIDAGAVAALRERSAQLRAELFAVHRQVQALVPLGTLAPYYSWRPPPRDH
jgi:non-ribosomal peptide synthetase component F